MNVSNDYQPARDDERLRKQGERIFEVCKEGNPLTLAQIAKLTGAPEASISAQLRTFRNPKGGSHTVDKEYLGNGLHAYTLVVNTGASTEPTQLSLFDVVSELGTSNPRANKEYYDLLNARNKAKMYALDILEAVKGL